jgi:hypothetical protein
MNNNNQTDRDLLAVLSTEPSGVRGLLPLAELTPAGAISPGFQPSELE